ncbi:MAG: glycosyltransferase [Microscillaceae bacterium]|nr:glycosyltransferase [Microscillaceae bacterium]
MNQKISIIIRSYNEEKHIGRLLAGIQQQDLPENRYEIILVDSGSTDATVNIATHYNVRIVNIRPEEFSFGKALNIGCWEATGELLVFASAHVYPVFEDWLSQLIQPFENPKIALVYGKQRGNEITKFSEHQIFRKWFPDASDYHQKHPFCNNANCAIRRTLWERIPYDEALTGLEDLDWAKKILALGYEIAYKAEAEIIHVHEETPQKIFNRYKREAIALKAILPSETFRFLDFVRLFSINLFSDFYHAFRQGCLGLHLSSILTFRWMQFWGTYQGFRQKQSLSRQMKQKFYYPNAMKDSSSTRPDSSQKRIDYAQHQRKSNRYASNH